MLLSFFAYTQLGISNLIPNMYIYVMLAASVGLMVLERLIYRMSFSFDRLVLLSAVMLAITILWNNYDILHHGFLPQFYNILIYMFLWLAHDMDEWHETFVRMMMLCGVFYTVWTYICVLDPDIYYSFVYPLMAPMGYLSDPKAGFTAFYSSNGLYISYGIIAFSARLFFDPRREKRLSDKLLFLFLITGMLLSGKRGQFIAVVFAVIVCYYLYNSNRKRSRFIKLIWITAIVVAALYIVFLFIPDVATIFIRFREQSQKGDVSSGRFLMWDHAWKLFLQKPVFGHGWRFFRYSSFTLVDYDVHNVFLQLLTEAGIVGALPFFLFIGGNLISAIKLMIKIRNTDEKDAGTSFIALAVTCEVFFVGICLTGTALYQVECMFPYFACCGIVYVHKRKYSVKKSKRYPEGIYDRQLG